MTRRGIVSLIIVLGSTAGLAAQTGPYSRLLITARGAMSGQSLIYGFDTRSGRAQTLFNQPMGTLTDIAMDRDNVGYTVTYKGRAETGLHFLKSQGSTATLVRTERLRNPEADFLSVNLTSEDLWVVGTTRSHGLGRLRVLVPGYGLFYEIENFSGRDVSGIVVERKTARFILALNGPGGGVVYSYSPYSQARCSTLAAGLGTITDLIQDPDSGGFLVSTRNRSAPILYVAAGSTPSVVKTFAFPNYLVPTGLAVDALAMDTRLDNGGDRVLWVLAGDRLFRTMWNAESREIRFPPGLQCARMPFHYPTGMIFEGNRDYLLTGKVSARGSAATRATLAIRLGPQYANQDYYIGASLAMQPGIPIGRNRMINLRPDPLFHLSVSGVLPMVFDEFKGDTGPGGEVTGAVIVPRQWRNVLRGVTLYFAAVVIDPSLPGRIRTVTNTVGLTLF